MRGTNAGLVVASGNVGIGTGNPSSKVDVNGGSITIRGANSGITVTGLASQNCIGTDAGGNFGGGTCGDGGTRIYDIVVGTWATGSDMIVNSADQFNLVMASAGLRGTTFSSTPTIVSIFFTPGIYNIDSVTVPYNARIYAAKESSTVWRVTDTSKQLATIYGSVTGITFDGGGLNSISRQVDLKAGARLNDVSAINILNASQSAGRSCGFCVFDSSNIVVDGLKFLNRVRTTRGASFGAECAPIMIVRSSDVVLSGIEISTMEVVGPQFTNETFIGFNLTNNITIKKSNFKGCGSDFILFGRNNSNVQILENKFEIAHKISGIGLIAFDGSNGGPGKLFASSMTISGNLFVMNEPENTASNDIIGVDSGMITHGLNISDNVITSLLNSTNVTFVRLGGSSIVSAIVKGNVMNISGATFASDSGTTSKITGNDNFLNGTEQ